MLTLAFISVERYVAIVHPLSHVTSQIITNKRVITMVTYPWLQGLAFALAPVFLGWIHYDYWEAVCAIDWQFEKSRAMVYVIIAFVLCFVLPGGVMVYCYVVILKAVHGRKSILVRINSRPTNRSSAQRFAKKTKTLRTLLVVVLMFFICMTPFCVTKLLKVISNREDVVAPYANLVSAYFGYLSSVVNPFIYAVFRPEFRRAYRRLWLKLPFYRWTHKDKTIQTSSSSGQT